MERAQSDPTATLSLQRRMLPDEGDDVRGRPNPGNVLIGYPHRRRRYRVVARLRPRSSVAYRLAPGLALGLAFCVDFAFAFDRVFVCAPGRAVVWPARTAWAAASRAMGTRNGEQLT